MRDLVTREALKAMARDAGKLFRELVAGGEEIPYDVREPGNGSALPQYVPLTDRFIRLHAPALRECDSFGSACAAIESADLAGPYLEELGVEVPPDPRGRAELAGVVFLCRLWGESTDFSLQGERLNAAVAELEAGGDVGEDEIEVVVPLRGFQMPIDRVELATATIVRADTVDVPAEARLPEGAGAAGWEPLFLAASRISATTHGAAADEAKPDAGARAVEAFRQLITALRLFKAGGVALGPYAWTRAGADRWRRISTGAGRPRPGGYRLAAEEVTDLVGLTRTLAFRSTPLSAAPGSANGRSGTLARAVSRFEAGLERTAPLEALNDHLLALRFLLEGGGPADLGLAIRVAGLCAEPDRREDVKAIVDRALALERELWSGEPAAGPEGAMTPAATAGAVEELLRAILRDAACGHLGSDLRSTADEILLADGFAVADGADEQRGGVEEWAIPEQEPDVAELQEEERESGGEGQAELWIDGDAEWEEPTKQAPAEPTLQVPEGEGRISTESRGDQEDEEEKVFTNPHPRHEQDTMPMDAPELPRDPTAQLLEDRPRKRGRAADRVAYLFPRPETTEWDVSELSYDRSRRAEPHPELQAS